MATSNAQLTKLAIGITSVAALAALTGSLSAGAAAPNGTNTKPEEAAADQAQQLNAAPQSGGAFGFTWESEGEEGETHEHEHGDSNGNGNGTGTARQFRRSPQFANPGTGSASGRTRSRHS